MLNATLVNRIDITKDLVILHILPDEGVRDFLPGQYMALGLLGAAPRPVDFPPDKEAHDPTKLIKRAYSIGSSPIEKRYIEFYLAVLPQGALTSRLALLKTGDRLYAAPKIAGTFTLHDIPADHNLIMVATGTGLAPYMSMLRTPSTWTPGRKMTVLHGVRYESDLAYLDELQSYAEKHPEFTYHNIVSRGGDTWKGHCGYVQKLLTEGLVPLDPTHDHVLLCGNPGMIDDMEKLLTARGFTEHSRKHPGNLHLERYW